MENNVTSEGNIPKALEAQKRSASYPAINVRDAYTFASRINAEFSSAAEVSREEIAVALKKNPSTIIRDMSSCVQFGFLEKNTRLGKYKLTKLFNDIFSPDSEQDKRLAFIKAFSSPKLYQDLINRYDNTVIPNELNNVLVKYFNITENAAYAASLVFIESGTEVGVINENKLLKYKLTQSVISKTQYAEVTEEINDLDDKGGSNGSSLPIKVEQVHFNETDAKKIPIHLTKDKMAYLVYPSDTNAKDIKLLDHAIKGILLRLDLENDDDNDL